MTCSWRKLAVAADRKCASRTPFFSAATVGWRRPVILLPTAWRKWNEHELRAVLAHEIAHIQGGDSLACLLAQVALALHFYHPMVHWLVARLRLEQELAADGVAAELSGGRRWYLKTLAAMALDQEDKNVVWPARAFVPARTAFLRRIVVLRNFHHPIRTASGRSRALAALCVMLAGLAVAGLRPPIQGQAAAQTLVENDTLPSSNHAATIDLSYIPDDTLAVVAFRPARILHQARQLGLDKLVTRGAEASGIDELLPGDFGLEKVEQLSYYGLLVPGSNLLIHLNEAVELTDRLPKAEKISRGDREVFLWAQRAYIQLDDRTIASCSPPDGQLLERLLSLKPGKGPAFLAQENWQPTASDDWVFAYHHALMNAVVSNPAHNANISPPFLASLFETPINEVKSLVLALRLEGDLKANAILFCESDDSAAQVRETVEAYKILGRNAILEQLSSMQDMDKVRDAAQQFFGGLKIDNQVRVVLANATLSLAGDWPGSLLPQIKAAKQAAQRTGSVENLKMLGITMHNYHDKYKHFPSSVLLGPDGKTPYSWRVAILPFLGQQAIYDRYRFDEPWDGPNNRKLLDEMPDVFRHPDAPANTQNACYFALTGPETVFPGEGTIGFAEIKDGTVNTLLFVEARRDIPWTKPEDIPYASDEPIPKLGGFTEGGFHAAFCSAEVRFLPDSLSETDFRAMATRDGREVVEFFRDK